MGTAIVKYHALVLELENGAYLGEVLLHPEVSRLNRDPERLVAGLLRTAKRIQRSTPPLVAHHRFPPEKPRLCEIEIELDADDPSWGWTSPLKLWFPTVYWRHGSAGWLARVPSVDLSVIAKEEDLVLDTAGAETLRYLHRAKVVDSLPDLIWLQRSVELRVESSEARVSFPTPRERERDAEADGPEVRVLDSVSDDLDFDRTPPAHEVDAYVRRIADALGGRRPSSVLLVGEAGVGKTTAFMEMVRGRSRLGMKDREVRGTTGSRLVSGMTGFGEWQEQCEALIRESARDKVILHLGDLVELTQAGKSMHNPEGVASFLRPAIQRRDLIAVVECTPEQLPAVERTDPHLLQAFQEIRIEQVSPEIARRILAGRANDWKPEQGVAFGSEALVAIDRLHRRHASYSAHPTRALRFMEHLVLDTARERLDRGQRDKDRPTPITVAEVMEAFSRETGLPQFMLDDELPLDVTETRQWFRQRVMGQPEAVDRVVDLLATVKTHLARPGKPLASLLFIGPTGVGKTELAKTTAQFLFGAAERLTRFDMSEYADPTAVLRLTGGAGRGEGLLTSRVREQPFAVILFDELEKAHPLFFDLLLQVLGEARLTDDQGRVADFSNAVVVMTSNLGAQAFQARDLGFGDTERAADAMAGVLAEVRNHFRPELINRLDRIVPFGSLDAAVLEEIARRHLDKLRLRDGILYRGVRLEVDDGVAAHLAALGNDPRYGARPLRRAMERELLAPLASALNRHDGTRPLESMVVVEEGRLDVTVEAVEPARGGRGLRASNTPLALAASASEQRRLCQAVARGRLAWKLRNDIHRVSELRAQAISNKASNRRLTLAQQESFVRLPALQRLGDGLKAATEAIEQFEERALMGIYTDGEQPYVEGLAGRRSLDGLGRDLFDALVELVFASRGASEDLTIGIYAEKPWAALTLARTYHRILKARGDIELQMDAWRIVKGGERGKPRVTRAPIRDAERFFSRGHEDLIGVSIGFSQRTAWLRWYGEDGLHKIVDDEADSLCKVHISSKRGDPYHPPDDVIRRTAYDSRDDLRRKISLAYKWVWDGVLERRESVRSSTLHEVLADLMDEVLRDRVLREATS